MASLDTDVPVRTTYSYVMDKDWGKLPDGWVLDDAAAVAVDSQDRVYVFNRGEHPMIVFDREGASCGRGARACSSVRTACISGPTIRSGCTDDGDHTVRQCTPEGKVLLEIGLPDKPAPYMSGQPFNRCTHTALSPSGDIFVSDGYGNARVHKYSPNGKHLHVLGRVRHRARRVQHRPQHHLRRRRLGLCRRPREPPDPGVRRQRPLRDAVEQPASAVRPVHDPRQAPGVLRRRTRSGHARQQGTRRTSAPPQRPGA